MKKVSKRKDKKAMLLTSLLADYEVAQKASRHLSPETLRNYLFRCRKFVDELGEKATLDAVSRPNVRRFLTRIGAEIPQSARMYRYSLESFFRWLNEEQYLQGMPTEGVKLPKVQPSRREGVPDDVISQLMAATSRLPVSDFHRARARCALAILTYTGLRKSEVLALKIEDVDFSACKVHVEKGKGGRSGDVFPCDDLFAAIKEFLLMRPKEACPNVLCHTNGQHLGPHALETILSKCKRVAGLTNMRITPHMFRHAFATRLLVGGATVADVQEQLRHESPKSTAIYLHSTRERLQQIRHLGRLPSLVTGSGDRNVPKKLAGRRVRHPVKRSRSQGP